MVNPKSLANLNPQNRSQGKVRINLTLLPSTIEELKTNYSSVSQGIEQIMNQSVPVAKVDLLQKKIKKLEKEIDHLSKANGELKAEILKVNEDPYSVHSKLEARCWELDRINGYLEKDNQKLELENQNLKAEIEKLKSGHAHNQILEKNNEIEESEKDLVFDSHEENYISVKHDYCDFIEYERISESVDGEAKLTNHDLIQAIIYSPSKKPLIEIKKSLDLVLGRFDGKVGKIEENYGGEKVKKWLLKFQCYDVKMSLMCLERSKQELSL